MSIFSIGARSRFNANPSHGHVWFSPIIPRTGQAILDAHKVFADASRETGLPMVTSRAPLPTTYHKRAFIFLFGIMVSTDPAVNKKNREAFRMTIKIAAEKGFVEYRTAPAFQDDVVATYSFNNHSLLRFHEAIKDAIDPNRCSGRRSVRDLAESHAGQEGLAMIRTRVQRVAFLGFLAFAPRAFTQMPAQEQLKKGEQVYRYWCWNCHGSGAGKPGTNACELSTMIRVPPILSNERIWHPRRSKPSYARVSRSCPRSAKQRSTMLTWMHWQPIWLGTTKPDGPTRTADFVGETWHFWSQALLISAEA